MQVAKKPAYVSFADAASLPIGFMTAVAAVHFELGISLPFLSGSGQDGFKPKSVLVLGGSSVVGAATIQLLRLVLPEVIILTTSSPKHHKRLSSLGADAAFDYTAANVVDQIRAASPAGEGVEVVIDAVNSVVMNTSFLDVITGPKKFAEVITGRNVESVPAGVDHHVIHGEVAVEKASGNKLFQAFGELLEAKTYRLPVEVEVVGHGLECIGEVSATSLHDPCASSRSKCCSVFTWKFRC